MWLYCVNCDCGVSSSIAYVMCVDVSCDCSAMVACVYVVYGRNVMVYCDFALCVCIVMLCISMCNVGVY